jgi:hypothetical protein
MTSIFFGVKGNSSAPVESTMRLSFGRKGRWMAALPAAMMHCLNWMTRVSPVASLPLPTAFEPSRC